MLRSVRSTTVVVVQASDPGWKALPASRPTGSRADLRATGMRTVDADLPAPVPVHASARHDTCAFVGAQCHAGHRLLPVPRPNFGGA